MNTRWGRLIAGAIVLAGLVTGAYVFLAVRPLEVPLVALEENVVIRVFGLGTVEARIVSKVGFEVGAALTELTVDHGNPVAKGDVLAHLSPAEQEARVRRAEAAALASEMTVERPRPTSSARARFWPRARAPICVNRAWLVETPLSQQTADEAQRDEDVAAAELSVALSEVEVARAQVTDARAHSATSE